VSTFITRLDGPGRGPRLAVKDLIDVEGTPTTAGCRAVADRAEPAAADAPCMAGAHAADARIMGKANLYELAFGASGVNPWFGTPANPFDPALVPGGSSSGSAVAVATDEADVAYGSDTGGSIRVPSAFCGTTGLKTTFGRVPVEGVWPLSASLDTVGPMARDVAGVVTGMQLLEPGFTVDAAAARVVGRVRTAGVEVDPRIDAAVDAALREAEFEVVDVDLPDWSDVRRFCIRILVWEAGQADGWLLDDREAAAKVSDAVAADLRLAASIMDAEVAAARAVQQQWQARLRALFQQVELLATPTVPFFPPRLEDAADQHYTAFTNPANLAGTPALALPVPAAGSAIPASLQLIGPWRAEAQLLATGAQVEAAVR
jgi:amidase